LLHLALASLPGNTESSSHAGAAIIEVADQLRFVADSDRDGRQQRESVGVHARQDKGGEE
jgi:hypothetical protein